MLTHTYYANIISKQDCIFRRIFHVSRSRGQMGPMSIRTKHKVTFLLMYGRKAEVNPQIRRVSCLDRAPTMSNALSNALKYLGRVSSRSDLKRRTLGHGMAIRHSWPFKSVISHKVEGFALRSSLPSLKSDRVSATTEPNGSLARH